MKKPDKSLNKFFSKVSVPEYTTISIFAILTGAFVGLAVVLFHESINVVTELFFDSGGDVFFFLGAAFVIIIPIIGMLIQAGMRVAAPDTAKRKGVTDVIKAVAIRGGYIPFKTTLFHFFAPIVCIGSGGTVGPEGPAAQLGGGVASKLSRLLGIKDSRRKMFTAAGAGAAISAVFNTPLGGIFFALEIILLNDFHSPTFSALILSSVTASAISRIFLGNEPAFIFNTTAFNAYEQLYIFVIIGVLAGIISLAFIRYNDAVEQVMAKKILKKFPRWTAMAFVGLLVGIAGFFYKDIFGIGYTFINSVLAESITWQIVLVLIVLKFILVPLILNSGGFGGVFAPSLFIGAGLGYLFSLLAHSIIGIEIPTTTIILVSMGAMLGGINSIPISSILIIFEMTRDYTFILPLMLAVVVSTMIVQVVLKGSVHIKHLEHQGYRITEGRETSILRSIHVKHVMKNDIVIVDENTPLPKLISDLLESPHNTFYVKNTAGILTGTISESELRPIITEYEHVREMLVASDIASPGVVSVSYSDSLDYVMSLFGRENVDEFPVMHDSDSSKILGTIRRHDIIAAYNKESLKYNLADGLSRELKQVSGTSKTQLAQGYSIIEKIAPINFEGKTLTELRLRNKYHLEVLMIKKRIEILSGEDDIEIITPDPNYKINSGDALVLFGTDEAINRALNW